MKKVILIIIMSAYVVFCFAQTENLVLYSDFNDNQELPIQIIITRTNLGEYERLSDTIKNIDKKFYFEKFTGEPNLIKITVQYKLQKKISLELWLLPGNYKLNFDSVLSVKNTFIEATSFQKRIDVINREIKLYKKKADSLVEKLIYNNQNIDNYLSKINFIRDSIEYVIDEQIYKAYAINYSNTPLGLYALCKYSDKNQRRRLEPEKISQLLELFKDDIKSMPSAKILAYKIELNKSLAVGKMFNYISLPDTVNRLIDIEDYKGRIILIEFWASWCGPCRAEIPNLTSVYDKYKNDGFQIIYISIDEVKGKKWWYKAIEDDNIGHLPQLIDSNMLAQNSYDIWKIPANFLIDKNGKIIAINLRGTTLVDELKRVFQY